MGKTTKNNEDLKMEAASEIGVDIRKTFDESDDNINSTSKETKIIKKMIERKVSN